MMKTERFDLCLTDMQLPDGEGLELVKWIQQYSPTVPVAVITAHGNMETAVRALKLGAFDFVSKPLDLAGLRKLVASAIKLSETHWTLIPACSVRVCSVCLLRCSNCAK